MIVGYYENKREDTKYLVAYHETKTSLKVYVYSELTNDDMLREIKGEPTLSPRLTMTNARSVGVKDYLVGAVNIQTVSGKVTGFGNFRIAQEVLDSINEMRTYSYSEDDIEWDEVEKDGEVVVGRRWRASDDNGFYEYQISKGNYSRIQFDSKHSSKKLMLAEVLGFPKAGRVKFEEVKDRTAQRIIASSIKDVDFTLLREMVDLHWYMDDEGNVLKDYKNISTKEEFYRDFLDPILDEYLRVTSKGEKLYVSTDTETTGLNFWDLSKENETLDHVVTCQFAWKDNQGITIFMDMEYFENVEKAWVYERVRWLIEGDGKPFSVKRSDGSEIEVDTSKVVLIGFNSPFDHRAYYHEGFKPVFDHDVLQMVFNLNPSSIKVAGGNSLTAVTKRAWGIAIPELRDMLGKGNEGKYRLLSDPEVAKIYGCSDVDHTRKAFFYVKSITPEKMWNSYVKYDMPLNNHLARVEYHGVRVDRPKMEKMYDILESDLNQLREFMFQYVGTMVVLKQSLEFLRIQAKIGAITEEEYNQKVQEISTEKNRYEFEMKSAEQRRVLYDLLGYPVLGYTADEKNPLPSTDKYTLKKLKNFVLEEPGNYMKEDLKSDMTGEILIKKKDFNKFKYPLCVVMLTYSDLKKDLESYVQPILKGNMEDKLFKSFSMARIETRRIMNPLQVMKAAYKSALLPISDDWYIWDWDMSQVEFRIMISLAGALKLIMKMHDPESDFHRETAALVNEIEAYLITGQQRSDAKGISFGLPYGLGLRSMTANKFNGVVNDETLYLTQCDIDKFTKENGAVMDFLEDIRDQALKESHDLSPELKRFIGYDEDTKLGKVENLMGFHRLFNLDDMDNRKKGQIRRWAGNYPIQSFAAELFRLILIRFMNRIKEEGLEDKVKWHLLIHDECFGSAHKSVNPFFLTKIIKESCMVTLKGHTSYFIGINFGKNWADALDEDRELPVHLSQEICERWDAGDLRDYNYDNPVESIEYELHEFVKRRLEQVVRTMDTEFNDVVPLDVNKVFSNFINYEVRGYIPTHFEPLDESIEEYVDGVDGVNPEYEMSCFLDWAYEQLGGDQPIKLENGEVHLVKDLVGEKVKAEESKTASNVSSVFLEAPDPATEVIDGVEFGELSLDDLDFSGYVDDTSDRKLDKDFDVKVRQELLTISDTGFDTEIYVDEFDMMEDSQELVGFMTKSEGTDRLSFVLDTVTIKLSSTKGQVQLINYLRRNQVDDGNVVILKIGNSTSTFRYLAKDFDYQELDEFVKKIDPQEQAVL